MSVSEFLAALNIFLSITASLGNALILVALHKETSFHPPTKLLFRCLAITDLCVGVISQPLFAVLFSSYAATGMSSKALFYINKLNITSSLLLCGVSVLTSTAISVDRLQALFSGLRYRHVVTLPRVRAVITCFWIIGITNASIYLWKIEIAFTVFFALIILSLTTSVFSYVKIYIKLRQRQLRVHAVPPGQPNGRQVLLNITRYKRTVSSAVWVQLTLAICYIPFLVMFILTTYARISRGKFQVAVDIPATLTYLNSSLNPILHCWRIRSVRQAAKDTIKQLNFC